MANKAQALKAKAGRCPGALGRARSYLRAVRTELRRVTWPSRDDVLRWSGVVVAALLFFGAFVAVLDNLVMTPVLVWLSGLEVPV